MMIRKTLLMTAVAGAMAVAGCGNSGGRFQLNGGNLDQAMHLFNAGGHLLNAASLGEKDEDAIGQSVAVVLTNRYRLVNNSRLARYVMLVGLTVANQSPMPGGRWVFGVLDTPEVNAYSGPNGYVFVTRGAIEHMQDEAELAGVLAHEVAHVCHHDGLHMVQDAERRGALTEAMQAAGDSRVAQFSTLVDTGADMITKQGYDQPQELAADHDGVQYMAAAGYDPASYLRFLRRLGSGGGLMSTHPGSAQRAGRVAQELQGMRPGGQTLADRFAANTRG